MKKVTIILLSVITVVICYSFSYVKNDTKLSDYDKTALLYMLEEEKLAHDVYVKMYEKWELMPFSNIPKSESYHIQVIKDILESNSIDYKIYEENGKFYNSELQNIFDELVEYGNISLENSLKVGAKIEELDIFDLENYLLKIENSEIKSTFNILIMGSKNHLRAFHRNLVSRTFEYTPSYITFDYYNSIINSKNEGCITNSNKKK